MTCLKMKMPPLSNPSGLPIAPNPGVEVIALTGTNSYGSFIWGLPGTIIGPGCPYGYIELVDAIYEHHAYSSLAGMTANGIIDVYVNPWGVDFSLDRWYQWTQNSPIAPAHNPQDSTVRLSVSCENDPPPPPPEEPGGVYCEPIALSPEVKILQAKEVHVSDSCLSPNINADKAATIIGSIVNAMVDAGDIFIFEGGAFHGNAKSKKIAYFKDKLFYGSIETDGYAVVRSQLGKNCKGKLGILTWPSNYYETTFEGGSMYLTASTFTACEFKLLKPYNYLWLFEDYLSDIAFPITIGIPNPYLPYSASVYNLLKKLLQDYRSQKPNIFPSIDKVFGCLVEDSTLWACDISGIEDALFKDAVLIYTSFNFSTFKIMGATQHIGGNSSADYIQGFSESNSPTNIEFIHGGGTVAVKHWRSPYQIKETWTYRQIADTAITNLGEECDIWCEGFEATEGTVNYTAQTVHLVYHTINIECNINISGDATNQEAYLYSKKKSSMAVVVKANGFLDIKGDLYISPKAPTIGVQDNGKLSVNKITMQVSKMNTIELNDNGQIAASEIELFGSSQILVYGSSKLAGQITIASSRAGADQASQGGTNINFMFDGLLGGGGDTEIYIDKLEGQYRIETAGKLLVIENAQPGIPWWGLDPSTIADLKAEIDGVFYFTYITAATLVTSNLQLHRQSLLDSDNVEGSNISFYNQSTNTSDLFEIPGVKFFTGSVNSAGGGMVKNVVFDESTNYGIADSSTFTNASEVGGTIWNNATIEDNCRHATPTLNMIADGKCELNIKDSKLEYSSVLSGGMYGFDPVTVAPREYVRATSQDKAIAAYGKPYIRVVGPSTPPINYDSIKLEDSTINGVTTQRVEGTNSTVVGTSSTIIEGNVSLKGGLSQIISATIWGRARIESSDIYDNQGRLGNTGAAISSSICEYNPITIKGLAFASTTNFRSPCTFEALGSFMRLARVQVPRVQPPWLPPQVDHFVFYIDGYSTEREAVAALRLQYPTAVSIDVGDFIYNIEECLFGFKLPNVPAVKENHRISKCSIRDSQFISCNVTFTDCVIDRCYFFNGDFKFIDCIIRN